MPEDTHLAATGHDRSRPVATSPDQYSLTIEDALLRYEKAGHPRTVRSIQRYCVRGHLDCLRQETTFGDRYMITPESVARHIAQIEELASATGRDMSRQAATGDVESLSGDTHQATGNDTPRPVATGRDMSPPPVELVAPPAPTDDRYVKLLESENEFLRDQIKRKDTQIGELSERARETNFLIKGLQNLVLQLQPGRASNQAGETSADHSSDAA